MSEAPIEWLAGTRVVLAPDGQTWTFGQVTKTARSNESDGVYIDLDNGQSCYATFHELFEWPEDSPSE
jgi:hypothetical protein